MLIKEKMKEISTTVSYQEHQQKLLQVVVEIISVPKYENRPIA